MLLSALRRCFRRRPRGAGRDRCPTARPCLEPLEDRTTPAALAVFPPRPPHPPEPAFPPEPTFPPQPAHPSGPVTLVHVGDLPPVPITPPEPALPPEPTFPPQPLQPPEPTYWVQPSE